MNFTCWADGWDVRCFGVGIFNSVGNRIAHCGIYENKNNMTAELVFTRVGREPDGDGGSSFVAKEIYRDNFLDFGAARVKAEILADKYRLLRQREANK